MNIKCASEINTHQNNVSTVFVCYAFYILIAPFKCKKN